MKISFSFIFALFFSLACCAAADDPAPTVSVTIENGTPMVACLSVTVTDADGDGALTINDALILAHDAAYDGGAQAGYAYKKSLYGISLKKLWGVDNGDAYGYYLNHATAASLADTVQDGDKICAFLYTDTTLFSDLYCYFDAEAVAPGEVTLTCLCAGWDSDWQPVTSPVAGAVILLDGAETEYVTDENGTVTLTVPDTASLITATLGERVIVQPVCAVKN